MLNLQPKPGHLDTAYLVSCGKCQQVVTLLLASIEATPARAAAHAEAWGYRNLAGLGWVCPTCIPTAKP